MSTQHPASIVDTNEYAPAHRHSLRRCILYGPLRSSSPLNVDIVSSEPLQRFWIACIKTFLMSTRSGCFGSRRLKASELLAPSRVQVSRVYGLVSQLLIGSTSEDHSLRMLTLASQVTLSACFLPKFVEGMDTVSVNFLMQN
jgi:hypothetical protein